MLPLPLLSELPSRALLLSGSTTACKDGESEGRALVWAQNMTCFSLLKNSKHSVEISQGKRKSPKELEVGKPSCGSSGEVQTDGPLAQFPSPASLFSGKVPDVCAQHKTASLTYRPQTTPVPLAGVEVGSDQQLQSRETSTFPSVPPPTNSV